MTFKIGDDTVRMFAIIAQLLRQPNNFEKPTMFAHPTAIPAQCYGTSSSLACKHPPGKKQLLN